MTMQQLIDDVQTLRFRVRSDPSAKTLAYVASYLLANKPLIELCLNAVREGTTEQSRKALQAAHKKLDPSAIPDSFWDSVASNALHSASSYYEGITCEITHDDLHMLRRALDYTSYCDVWRSSFRLLLSPA